MPHPSFRVYAVLALAGVAGACAPQVQLAVAPDIHSATWAVEDPAEGPSGLEAEGTEALDWAAFGSTTLDQLLAKARAANTDIAMANSRIAQAAADLRIARAANGPLLGASASGQSNARGGAGNNAFRDTYVTGDLNLSYTLDLSGRLKASKRVAYARYRAAGYEADAMRLNIEAAVASAYIDFAALSDRIAVAEQGLANARSFERILRLRREAGLVSEVDANLQITEANALAVNLSRLREARSRARNALAVLVGEEAPLFALGPASLSEFTSPRFEPFQPATLLSRRPDMLAAAAIIEAADGNVQRARAEFVPDVEFSAGTFVDSAAGGGIFSPGFAFASRIFATIFDSGRLKAQVYRASAEQQEAVEAFRKALLGALANAQDALAASAATMDRMATLDQSHRIAARTAALARARFSEGSDDFGTVLDADRRKLETEDSLILSRQEALNSAVQLYTAMGGKPD